MELSRPRKIYLLGLALAVTALLLDRSVLAPEEGGPKRAQASALSVGPMIRPSSSTTRPQADPPAPESLAARLKALAEADGFDPASVANAFALSKSWLARLQADTAKASRSDSAEQFARKHRLMSLVLSGARGCAVVDGEVVHVGQQFDGFTLVRLTPHSAVFGCGAERVELQIDPKLSPGQDGHSGTTWPPTQNPAP